MLPLSGQKGEMKSTCYFSYGTLVNCTILSNTMNLC